MKTLAVGLSSLLLVTVAHAAGGHPALNYVDGYYIPDAELKFRDPGLGTAKDDGDGFGVRAGAQISDQFFFVGEWQSIETDLEIELDQLRLGIGFLAPLNEIISLTPRIEMLRAKLDAPGASSESETGFGFHGGVLIHPNPHFALYGGIGYITDIDDLSGPEYLVGGRFLLTPQFSLFVDYRSARLSDSGFRLEINDIRLGAGFHF